MILTVDRQTVEIRTGESLLVAMLRADLHPTGGGCLCLAGDCAHCLVTVDGVAYSRACQIPARPGLVVERNHRDGAPPLALEDQVLEDQVLEDLAQGHHPGQGVDIPSRHLWCDVVVIGTGPAGRAEAEQARADGREVVTLDAADGQEVVGIYQGPLVVARTAEATLCVHPRDEVVVATGAAELQPVVPGSHLRGLLTARAATELAAAGFELGKVVAIGESPAGLEAQPADGTLCRFEGNSKGDGKGNGKVEAVVTIDEKGRECRYPCDTVSLGLGFQARDALLRMGRGLPVRAVGDAAKTFDPPPCPSSGEICPCAGVIVEDLESVWQRGFHELELVKRATLAGTGTCQGSTCLPYLRSFLAAKGGELQAPFTARPMTRQPTVGEIAAGAFHQSTPRTPLHDEHLRLHARMERSSGWWRPWTYGDTETEYLAARKAVSIGDIGTLGKFIVAGPDAQEFLNLILPTRVETLKPGACRYVLLLDERGYVVDDGLIAREHQDPTAGSRFYLTLTSAGSTFGELWLRDWAESKGDVTVLNQTQSLGAINVTGPKAAELLARAGTTFLPSFSRHGHAEVAGIQCRILRLSFTGELSYELHHAAADSVFLWRALLELGKDLGIRPHGLDALLKLRLDKGHLVVGLDTDFDSTPRRLGYAWAVRLDKDDFVGKAAIERTNRIELDRQLVGLEMDLPAPPQGTVVRRPRTDGTYESDGTDEPVYAGYVTSSSASPVLGRAVMLAWIEQVDGQCPRELVVDGRPARRVDLPFYDPKHQRSRAKVPFEHGRDSAEGRVKGRVEGKADREPANGGSEDLGRFQRLEGTRIAGPAHLLDRLQLPSDRLCLPIAPDELLITSSTHKDDLKLDGGGADALDRVLIERETGFAAAWLDMEEALEFLERSCSWPLPAAPVPAAPVPADRPAFAQGRIADLPIKLWFEEMRVLFLVPGSCAAELEARMK